MIKRSKKKISTYSNARERSIIQRIPEELTPERITMLKISKWLRSSKGFQLLWYFLNCKSNGPYPIICVSVKTTILVFSSFFILTSIFRSCLRRNKNAKSHFCTKYRNNNNKNSVLIFSLFILLFYCCKFGVSFGVVDM